MEFPAQNLWLTEDDALKAGHTGRNIMDRPVVLPNGTYFGTLWVYHELHCIVNFAALQTPYFLTQIDADCHQNKLYHALFPDLYPQNLTKFQKGMQLEHNGNELLSILSPSSRLYLFRHTPSP